MIGNELKENQIDFYHDERGISPIEELIEELSKKAANGNQRSTALAGAIFTRFKHIKIVGADLKMPGFEYFGGKHSLWQIRIQHAEGWLRIFFARMNKNTFLILNYFNKKGNKTPPREIEKANRLLDDHLSRH